MPRKFTRKSGTGTKKVTLEILKPVKIYKWAKNPNKKAKPKKTLA